MKSITKPRRSRAKHSRQTAHPILSSRSRLSEKQAETLLRSYAERRSPKETAQACGISLNTAYAHYNRIRARLILTRYYDSGALSYDEDGLGPEITEQLKRRRGIRPDEIYPHAAELIDWAEEWPPRLVLKHSRKIIDLTGPLDVTPNMSDLEIEKLQAYIRCARVELTLWRLEDSSLRDEAQRAIIGRAKDSLDRYRREYRTASKRLERERQGYSIATANHCIKIPKFTDSKEFLCDSVVEMMEKIGPQHHYTARASITSAIKPTINHKQLDQLKKAPILIK